MTAKELHAKVPGYSCPSFDAAIKEIEDAREVNSKLREILKKALSELMNAEEYISQLERLTDSQQDTIESLRAELASDDTRRRPATELRRDVLNAVPIMIGCLQAIERREGLNLSRNACVALDECCDELTDLLEIASKETP